MLDEDLKHLLQSLLEAQKETDLQLKETDLQLKETDRQLKEQSERTDRQLKELGQQIGGLGNKFGGFTEGLALPSMTRILQQRFGVETVAPRVRSRQGADLLELDVLGYANGVINSAYVVEVKSRLRARDLEQTINTLERFPQFFPEHADKRLYGIIATVDMPERERQQVLEAGLYLAVIEDELFELQTPPGFKPRCFSEPVPSAH